jgi:hypothetical protein
MMKTPRMSVYPHLRCLRVSLTEESVEPLRGLIREVEKMGDIRPKLSVRFSFGEWRGMKRRHTQTSPAARKLLPPSPRG